ncbi:hypothetical protein [Anaerosolibacter sp.]|uniref:hypothetical protein n=1 Tax=Anaerosolibacter sp. TaxID=1872527 RepID=UPI0039EE6983
MKKNKSNTPRHKRLSRDGRLNAARHWIPKYEGKNLVRGYSKHFAVDLLGAVKELQMLGIHVDESYIFKLKQSYEAQRKYKEKLKRKKAENEWIESFEDEEFCFYVNYIEDDESYDEASADDDSIPF